MGVSTTRDHAWKPISETAIGPRKGLPDVLVILDNPRQIIDGFGASFSELGWLALARLSVESRENVMRELFAPGVGANFTLCRMPIGANDFSRGWYSYDEDEGDLELDHFSIANDLDTLVPFIREAQTHQPALRLWASPWSPPSWMKSNGHYAGSRRQGGIMCDNGLRPDQVRAEGTDTFIQDDRFLAAYAAYFGRFIDEYRALGIPIEMVMPQNEFNSPQVFPSCTWTPEGLTRFVTHLGPQMRKRGVELFVGTLERADDHLLDNVLQDPTSAPFVTGAGLQWAGKHALGGLRSRFPQLRVYQTEQECGDGKNEWRFARYTWTQIKHYLAGGASGYMYWNIALEAGGVSRWGWPQNSLVVVEPATGSFTFTPDYYVFRHLTRYVAPGARLLQTVSLNGYENQLAFQNHDGTTVVVIHNDMPDEQTISFGVGRRTHAVTLAPDSINSLLFRRE